MRHSETPVRPSEAAARLRAVSVRPSDTPARPREAPLRPSEIPARPNEAPVCPSNCLSGSLRPRDAPACNALSALSKPHVPQRGSEAVSRQFCVIEKRDFLHHVGTTPKRQTHFSRICYCLAWFCNDSHTFMALILEPATFHRKTTVLVLCAHHV